MQVLSIVMHFGSFLGPFEKLRFKLFEKELLLLIMRNFCFQSANLISKSSQLLSEVIYFNQVLIYKLSHAFLKVSENPVYEVWEGGRN